jgi:signal transduction histidine kinase
MLRPVNERLATIPNMQTRGGQAMLESLADWFSTALFVPHGMCLAWREDLLLLHVVSDGLIAISYYSIPFAIIYFVRRRADLAYPWVFWLFAAFILSCGTTHLFGIWTIWDPEYVWEGLTKAATAAVSVITAVLLWPLIPKALALPSPAQLTSSNAQLRQEIGERQQAEAALQRTNALLETANRELEEFCSSISHDLRVPLRAIDGFSQILRRDYAGKFDAEGQRVLSVVHDSAKRMSQQIDDMLAFAGIGHENVSATEVDMNALVREALEQLEPAMAGRDIKIDIAPLPPTHGDLAMLRHVWSNLLDNAVKFTKPKANAVIEVGGRIESGETVYFVKDNGVGFDMQYVGKLFGMFQRLHGHEEFPGTGIGLALVKRIVGRHGGRVWAKGQLDEGATVYFALPAKGSCLTPPNPRHSAGGE